MNVKETERGVVWAVLMKPKYQLIGLIIVAIDVIYDM